MFGLGTKVNQSSARSDGFATSGLGDFSPNTEVNFGGALKPRNYVVLAGLVALGVFSFKKFGAR